MFQYVVKRLLLLIVTLFGITVLTFLLTRLTPGDPAALQVQGSGSAGAAVGSYDDLVELSRRNLGLDKPLLLNLEFPDPESRAHEAITDLFRDADFWWEDGARRLVRQSTIALRPALERFAQIGEPDEPFPGLDGEAGSLAESSVRRERLANLFRSLAGSPAGAPQLDSPQESFEYWRQWAKENESRLTYAEARIRVQNLAQSDTPENRRAVRMCGGYAIPPLFEALQEAELSERWVYVDQFQQLTGFAFVTSEEDFQERPEEILQRMNSWRRRESLAFFPPSPLDQAVNVVAETQFGLWTVQALTLDFGDSYVSKRPVNRMIAEALPVSIALSGASILLSYLLAIPLGIFSAVKRNSPADQFVTVMLFVLYSLPSFWVAGLLLLTMTGKPFLDWFPARGLSSEGLGFGSDAPLHRILLDYAWHMVLPLICLTYGSLAFISRQMRSAMLETLTQDFITTARAKGVSGYGVIFRHALRNSLIPILTISAGLLPELIAGAVIIESIFTIPGMGTLTLEAIVNRDYPVVNAVLFFSAFLTLIGILLADLSYALADPRIAYE